MPKHIPYPRYGITGDLEKLMAETSNFYFLYDIKQESIPGEEEWALRYEQFVKHIPEKENVSEDENEIIKVSDAEEGESVDNMEDVRPSQFEENLAKTTLSDEL